MILRILAALLLAVPLVGSRPELDPQRYGEVISHIPRVPGAEKPYPLQRLEESKELDPESEK